MIQAGKFGFFAFYLANPDILDKDQASNAFKLEKSKWQSWKKDSDIRKKGDQYCKCTIQQRNIFCNLKNPLQLTSL